MSLIPAILLGLVMGVLFGLALEKAREEERNRAALWPAPPIEEQAGALFIAEEMQTLLATARRVVEGMRTIPAGEWQGRRVTLPAHATAGGVFPDREGTILENMRLRIEYFFSQLLQRRDVVQDPNTASMRSGDEIAISRMDN